MVTYIIYREIMHNVGYFLSSTSFVSHILICSCGIPFKLHYETNKFS